MQYSELWLKIKRGKCWKAEKECHPFRVYQNYNGLIINNGSQKHKYICKCINLPTTCFGLIRPSSGWNTVSEEKNYLSDLNAGVQGRGRDLVYKYGVSGWNGVGTSVCQLGEFICWSAGPRANRPTNELTKRTHICANTISATNPIFVNEISSPTLHTCI